MTPLERLRRLEPPVVCWRMARSVADGIFAKHPVRNPQTGQGWTIEQLAGETWDQWMHRTGRKRA